MSEEQTIYQIKITLEGSKPPIWRRLLVPGDVTLADLHDIIQIAFGWEDYHLHQFMVGGRYFGVPNPDYDDYVDMHDEQDVTLGRIIAGEGFSFHYEYDFGDDWRHQVLVEKILAPEPGRDYPVCVTGRRACPPEDVGGMWGYYQFLEAIQDPDHEEHEEYLEWVGGEFEPEAFDRDEANRILDAWRQQEVGRVYEKYFDMALLNRNVAILKPKQAMVDWINRVVSPSDPVTLEEIVQDCTAILVPDLESREDVLDYLGPVKPSLFEMELESWSREPSDWPQKRTSEMFDAWFDIEVHSMVWAVMDEPSGADNGSFGGTP
jgi:hypothetical protein